VLKSGEMAEVVGIQLEKKLVIMLLDLPIRFEEDLSGLFQ
jgi:hypothetical protein